MAGMTTPRSTFRLLLLFTIFAFGVVGSKDEQASVGASLILSTASGTNTDNSPNGTTARDNETEKSSSSVKSVQDVKAKEIEWDKDDAADDDEDEEEEDEEEYGETEESGGEVDEYEDELREMAESHEAMLKDESKNRLSNTTSPARTANENSSFSLKNFDSRENSNEIVSNEKLVSNEAVTKEDEEVAELLRYKQKAAASSLEEKLVSGIPELGTKVKRVPTVKKELSTQKEILNANETQLSLPKTLVSNVEIVNRIDDETNHDAGFGLAHADPNRYELVGNEMRFDEEYPVVEASDDIIRKLDKRRPYDLEAMKSYITGGYDSQQEQRGELGDDGIGPEDDLIDLLSDMYEHPELFLKLYQMFAAVMDVPRKNRFRDSQKRSDASDSLAEIPMTVTESDTPETASTTKKPKKKKKKKKLRQRLPKTTSTSEPPITTAPKTPMDSSPTPPFLPTTAANWPATTQAQWRLVAERLFGDPWSENHHELSPGAAKARSTNERLPSIDEKQRVNLKTLNDERQALMLESAREYSQPRRLHYGKINTHEKGSPNSNEDNNIRNYDSSRNMPLNDYESSDRRFYQPRPNPLDRYDYYRRQMMRQYGSIPIEDERENDYDEISRAPHDIVDHRPFAKTHRFKPLGREYASTKTWQDSRYDYARPWKDKSRTSTNGVTDSGRSWPWKITPRDYKIWIPNYRQPWSRDSNYWQRLSHVENELNELLNGEKNEKNSPLQSQQQQSSWRPQHDESGRWKIDQDVDIKSWKMRNRPKIYGNGVAPLTSLEKSKNRSELSDKAIIANSAMKDKPILPKITMKTWNSLTSDPATWPFKLNGAKPWPKDKNGNSYNPNAELVRKLGLDKQERLLSSAKDSNNNDDVDNKIVENTKIGSDNRNDVNSMMNSVKSSINWPEKLNAVNGWMDKSRNENDGLAQRDEPRQLWQTSLDNNKKIWSHKAPISPKISSVGAWIMPADQSTWRPFDLKHKPYDQRSDDRLAGTWNERTNSDETDGNSWQRKNDVITSGGWQEKNNGWNIVRPVVYPPDKSASTINSSTWPSKWRQFAYHKVTAAPIAKPGSLNVVDGSIRPRNSYIAVSAVSPPKYTSNEWRKNDIEETQLDRTSDVNHVVKFDRDDPTDQLRKSSTNERWNPEARINHSKDNNRQRNDNDPLEHQLEALRREPYWNHDQLHQQSQKRSNASGNSSIIAVTTQATQIPLKSLSQDNEILNNHVGSIKITESQKQQEKNVTK